MAYETSHAAAPDSKQTTSSTPKAFKARIERCRTKRRDLLREWQLNVDYRRGKALDVDTDENRIPVPVDWSMTKAKIAQLFSQVPSVVVTAEGPYALAAPPVQKRLNRNLRKAKVGAAMDEVMPDVVNAAGIGVALVSYEAREEMRQVPAQDPSTLSIIDQGLIRIGLKQPEMVDQPFVVDRRFCVTRVSASDFLWATDFVGSDFDAAPWIGYTGRMTFAEALVAFEGKITEEDKDKVVGDTRTHLDSLAIDDSETYQREEDVVSYDEIFYWRYLYHPEEKYFSAIQRMVFVHGKDEPVVNEPWKGQRFDQSVSGGYVGACRPPVRVLTLNYLSDETIPPSDSAMGRPIVRELIESRANMRLQRKHSKPIRWFDVNRVDPDIQTNLMMGDWQGFIPTQGVGDKAIGEVARSNYPRDDHEIDRIIKGDLNETWSVGPNQMSTLATGERSAAEAKIAQGSFATRVGQERARCVEFFLGIADVMMGLMSLYDDFELPDPADGQRLSNWDRTRISHELAFTIRGDATVLVDTGQRIDRLERYINLAGKSGYARPKELFEELASLHGIDPSHVVQQPPEKGPEPLNISFRFTGSEDLANPMAVALLKKAGQLPSMAELKEAMLIIQAAQSPDILQQMPDEGGGPGGQPPMDDNRPDWQSVDRVNSRRDATQA